MRRAGEHSWRARAFAWGMVHGTGPYERWMAERKQSLLGDLSGEVVEIGPGSGVNLSYLPREVRWTGIEPNPCFHPYIRNEAARLDRPVRLQVGMAEDLGLEDASVDAVVGTLVLCSVDRVEAALEEILRGAQAWRALLLSGARGGAARQLAAMDSARGASGVEQPAGRLPARCGHPGADRSSRFLPIGLGGISGAPAGSEPPYLRFRRKRWGAGLTPCFFHTYDLNRTFD